jgi:hypothetical protein
MAHKQDLSTLPLWIVKVNRKWYKNTKTQQWISAKNIQDHLPKEIKIEVKPTTEYWWNKL